ITHRLRPKTTLSVEGVRRILDTSRADRNLAFGSGYVSTQIRATLSHRYRKLTGRLKVGYIHDEYLHDDSGLGKKRKDDLYTGELSVDHALRRWLRLGGAYRYTRLNSNFPAEEYGENTIMIYVSLIL
ncbi:MAG: outer membrane beta-barrel protein, partial [Deltaproteobacteria bacterium]|nr:outer membrane beta-barrel protein [Deltaproteobacteria bacterium]